VSAPNADLIPRLREAADLYREVLVERALRPSEAITLECQKTGLALGILLAAYGGLSGENLPPAVIPRRPGAQGTRERAALLKALELLAGSIPGPLGLAPSLERARREA
jgi:hypothetical protein